MCARKLKYAAGDDLMLYATPKESLEASKKELEEKERWKRVCEEQERLMKLSQEQEWLRRNQRGQRFSPPPTSQQQQQQQNGQADRIRYGNGHGNRIVSAPPAMVPQHVNNVNVNGYNTRSHTSGGTISPTHKKNRPPPIPVRSDGTPIIPNNRSHSSSPVKLVPNSSSSFKDTSAQRDINIAKQLFHNHDIKRKDRLTAEELQNLLQNDDNSRFCISSIDSIIDFFGQTRFGTINENEFISLYQKIKHWRKIYVDNDINHSFTININEYHNCLQELKYLIPLEISEKLFDQYAEFNINSNLNSKELKFDKFVESLIWLMKLTKMFRKFDSNHKGIANISYKDFIDTTMYLGRFLPH
ncbi:peflin [Monosporozyma unispora]|nr:hypothetical protein C6P44_001473 [Kazachstania unispora]